MIKKILIFLFVVIVGGVIYFFKRYPNNIFIPYHPDGPTYQTGKINQEKGYPVRELDQAADSVRKYAIDDLDQALRRYYTTNNKAPETLETLVSAGEIKSVKLDKITNQPPTYYPDDPQHGCRVESTLSDGTIIYGYCK